MKAKDLKIGQLVKATVFFTGEEVTEILRVEEVKPTISAPKKYVSIKFDEFKTPKFFKNDEEFELVEI